MTRRRTRTRRKSTLIKSNNPHLAGGEIDYYYLSMAYNLLWWLITAILGMF